MGVQPCPAWPFQGDCLPGPREGCNSSFSHQVADDHSQEGSLGGRVPWTWAYWNFLKKVRYLSHSLKSRPNYNSVEEKWLMLVLPLFLSLISRNGALLGVDFPLTIQFQEWCSRRIATPTRIRIRDSVSANRGGENKWGNTGEVWGAVCTQIQAHYQKKTRPNNCSKKGLLKINFLSFFLSEYEGAKSLQSTDAE